MGWWCGSGMSPGRRSRARVVGTEVATARGDDGVGGGTTSSVTLGLAVGDRDAAFGEGLADFGVDLIGGYVAGGAGVDPMRCLTSAAAMWPGRRCGRTRTARKQRGTQIERRLHMASLDGSGTWSGRTPEPTCRLRCVSYSTRVAGTSALRPRDRACDPVEKKRVARANHHGTPRSTT